VKENVHISEQFIISCRKPQGIHDVYNNGVWLLVSIKNTVSKIKPNVILKGVYDT